MVKKLHPVHPGEVLSEEFLKPLDLSQNRLAIEIGVDARFFSQKALQQKTVFPTVLKDTFWQEIREKNPAT